MSLYSGERQVSESVDGIRRDHVARYEWAATKIEPGSRVVDFACGIGYGAKILADAGHEVMGVDIDSETIAFANANYAGPHFVVQNGNMPCELPAHDCAVSFETIEHIEDPRPLLKSLRQSAKTLLASVPNEAVMPWMRADGSTTAFHFRHYTRQQFAELLNECGWEVLAWYGQAGPESDVVPDIDGRTLIAHCRHGEFVEKPVGKHIAILGLGPSVDQYVDIVKRQGGRHKFCDEVWSINALGDVLACDLVFHMDDIRIQEIRAAAAPASNIAAMVAWIKHSPVPVVTSRTHADYPALVEFPLEDVLNRLGHAYFNSTAAYAVALAIHFGADQISIFGMDFTYPNVHSAEKGRACVEFWLGQAHARGIKINMPQTTTLMDSNCTQAERLYGYDAVDVDLHVQANGCLKVGFKERATLPTAEQIERAYDHSASIVEQHKIPRS